MRLEPYTETDLGLTERLETDPRVMAELGGPIDRDAIPAIHQRRLRSNQGDDWWLKILPEPGAEPAGVIGVWINEAGAEPVHEVGWMVLPEMQGRGIAREALQMLIERCRSDPRFSRLHAWPGATNAASNALCRGAGFDLLGETDVDYAGRPLHVNHWALDLRGDSGGNATQLSG
jgi:RimJ/RimL family protein N-acetyltransferase